MNVIIVIIIIIIIISDSTAGQNILSHLTTQFSGVYVCVCVCVWVGGCGGGMQVILLISQTLKLYDSVNYAFFLYSFKRYRAM